MSNRLRALFPARFWIGLLAGAALPLAFAPFDFWPATLVVPAVVFWRLAWAEPRHAFVLGWWFGVGKYAVGASWIYVSIHVHGGASPLLAGALVAVFVVLLALLSALQAWLYVRFLTRGSFLADALTFAASYVLLEWTLTWVLTGFPWLFVGYGHLDTPLRHWAPVGGVLLVSLMAVVSGCAVAAALLTRRQGERIVAALLAVLPWIGAFGLAYVTWVGPSGHGTVAIVQGNVPQEVKWNPDSVGPILDKYRTLTVPFWGRDLVVWPEAAVTLFVRDAEGYLDAMSGTALANGSALVLGIPDIELLPDGTRKFSNTAIVVGDGDGRYVKRHLVPFGEYVPFESTLRGAIEFFDLPMSHAAPGPDDQPPLVAKRWTVGVAICYEVVYPELVREAARNADLLVTLSNDTWFGRSLGPLQHMQMARMRALENGRWLLRATNDGVTAIVDASGAVIRELPRFEAGVLDGEFDVMSGTTPFLRFGGLPVVLSMLVLCVLPLTKRRETGILAAP